MTIHRHAKSGYALSTDGPWVERASDEEWSYDEPLRINGQRPASMTDDQWALYPEGARQGRARPGEQMRLVL